MKRLTDEELAEHIARARGCASAELPGEMLRSLLAEVRELRDCKARADVVINCDQCSFGVEWTELGSAYVCDKCGGWERAMKP